MSKARRSIQFIYSTLIILSMSLSASQSQSASAQGGDGIKRQVNAESGKVSFIGPESGRPVAASLALGSLARPADPAMALAKRFAPEFGLKNPERDLSVKKAGEPQNGRITVRYQQNYEGIPVMGGELIVNTNENGDLYSMNGEVSPNLTLSTQPTVDVEQAKQTALEAAVKWYQKTATDFVASEPELWIYDESLLHSSTRPAELVWRMEVTSADNSLPLRELILINAQRGNISLHFNQIDTAWGKTHEITKTTQTFEITAPILSLTNTQATNSANSNKNSSKDLNTFVGATWYVATTGLDSNSCSTPASPCATIQAAIDKMTSGDEILVATGVYNTNPSNLEIIVGISKDIILSGGWTNDFTLRNGKSTVDGQNFRGGIYIAPNINADISNFIIQNGLGSHGYNEFGSITYRVGGGIYNKGITTLDNIIIRNNIANYGGGIFNNGVMVTTKTTIFNNSNMAAPVQDQGGGIYQKSGQLQIVNSTISNNTSKTSGGGIYVREGIVVDINNSTITQNVVSSYPWGLLTGGGISNPNNESVTIRNTIIAGNAAVSFPDCSGQIISGGHNIIGIVDGCDITAISGDLIGTRNSPISTIMGTLADNGGSTFTHALLTGSIAINAGDAATCAATDQRGVLRPQDTVCDIGAFEGSVSESLSGTVKTYDSSSLENLPGTFVCDQTNPTCTTGDAHAKSAHKYAIGTYNLYLNNYNRNSIDNNNVPILSSVHYCTNAVCPYDNAFWNGAQMVYGDAYGFPLADDLVAHELTHGVTQYESNLFSYYQAGAINEAFSDLWGEYYDQTNGQGNDAPGVKWLLGEDTSGLGAIRNMSNPPALGDPDKISSANYYEGEDDNGGVHTNSGINNKAVFLMVNGSTFNGKTVSALGWVKTTAIYYEVNTKLLSSGADYSDLYYALQQACSNLIGQQGITSSDCTEVKDAIDAVEMNAQPAVNFNTDVSLCTANSAVFSLVDNLESGTGKWTFTNGAHTRWQYDSPYGYYAHSGVHSLYADDYPGTITDASARLISLSIPNNAYLHFAHAYGFELNASTYYDGGVLEYSINGGSSWVDAGPLMNFNGYDGTISSGFGNPLAGRSAFVGDSHGYISTRLNLASLAGRIVTFRWRMGLDASDFDWGWWVDDVKVYTCPSPANISVLVAGANLGNYVLQPYTSLRQSYAGLDNGPVKVVSTNGTKIVASERVAYSPDGGTTWTSHSELMGLPLGQLTNSYTFPWYNNLDLNSQLRFGNVGTASTTVTVTVGGVFKGAYTLAPNASQRISYAGLDAGPVRVTSSGNVPIIASMRVAYFDGSDWTSFSEMMGLPSGQLTNSYIFPWYNNLDLNSQLRFGNVGAAPTTVTVTVGGVFKGAYTLIPNESKRISYAGLDAGPVRITSSGNVPIIASMRVAYNDGSDWTDFSEMMGLPIGSLSTRYSFPVYNNVNLNTQLRFANVGNATTTVTVTIGGVFKGSYVLTASESKRISYAGVNSGPVVIQSSGGIPIIASERVAYNDGSAWTSFAEMMGLPQSQLTTTFLFPWYNNIDLNTQLRFGVP